MERLKKESKRYHDIIFYIWQLLAYYADLFGFDAPEAAHKLHVNLFYDKTLTKIRASVPRIKEIEPQYSIEEMRSMMNEALEIMLQGSSLQPFAIGSNYYEVVEPLYISIIVTNGYYFDFDFLWVDNLDAYKKVKENRMENIMRII